MGSGDCETERGRAGLKLGLAEAHKKIKKIKKRFSLPLTLRRVFLVHLRLCNLYALSCSCCLRVTFCCASRVKYVVRCRAMQCSLRRTMLRPILSWLPKCRHIPCRINPILCTTSSVAVIVI